MAVRAITSSKFGAHSGPLFKKLSVLDVLKLYKFLIVTFVYLFIKTCPINLVIIVDSFNTIMALDRKTLKL